MNTKLIWDLLDKSQKNLNESMNQYISTPFFSFTTNRFCAIIFVEQNNMKFCVPSSRRRLRGKQV